MNSIKRVGAAALAAAVAGCGGGGGSDTVALKSAGDVARELQNISTLYVDNAPASKAARPGPGTRATGVRGLLSRSVAGQSRASRSGGVAKATGDCDSGTYTYDEFIGQVRNLPLFAANPVLDYVIGTDRDCKFVEGTFSQYYDGRYEYGDNWAYTEGTAQAPYYDYYLDGSGSTPYSVVLEDTDFNEKITIKTVGRSEARDNGTTYESRDIFGVDFRYAFDGDSIRLDIDAGRSGDPLIFVDNYNGDGTLSLDGPLHYSSDLCDGGRLTYDTLQGLTLGFSEPYGYFPNAGVLRIESGSAGVTLEFQSNGDVFYTFDSGQSGTVTLDDVASAEGCVFMP